MKRIARIVCISICCLSFPVLAISQDFKGTSGKAPIIEAPARSFTVGENLNYSVQWLGIPVGNIVLSIEGMKKIRGSLCYNISATVYPNSFFQHFYDLKYKVNTYVDSRSFHPLRFEKTRCLNGKENKVVIEFDRKDNQACFVSEGDAGVVALSLSRDELEKENPRTNKISEDTQDLLSAFYYFRTLYIAADKDYPLHIYYDQRNWPLQMKTGKPFYREARKKRAIPMIKVNPVSQLNDYILGRRDFVVYFSTEASRIPIEFSLSTAVGPVRGIIQDLPSQD